MDMQDSVRPSSGKSDRAVTGRAGRPHPWGVWLIAVVLLLGTASRTGSWITSTEITGRTELDPGASATLQFRASMWNDRGATWWIVALDVIEIHAAEAPDSGKDVAVTLIGRVDGSGSSTCSQPWEVPDTGAPQWDECTLAPECSGDAMPCEATVEFELVSMSDEPVTVQWVVYAEATDPLGCFESRDDVEGAVTLEQVE